MAIRNTPAKMGNQQIQGLADGIEDTDGATVGQLHAATDAIAVSPTSPRFGAVGDDATDDKAAIDSWLQYLIDNHVNGVIPPLKFLYDGDLEIDLAAVSTSGVKIYGATRRSSVFHLTDGHKARIFCSGGTPGSPVIQANSILVDFGFQTNVDDFALTVGTDNFADQCNENELRFTVTNSSTDAAAGGIKFNALYSCHGAINTVVNGNPATIAAGSVGIKIRKMSFSDFKIGAGGTDIGTLLTDDFVYGNMFRVPDNEIVNTAIKIDGAAIVDNAFLVGTNGYNTWGVDALGGASGANNVFLVPNKNSSAPFIRPGSKGVSVITAPSAQVVAPTSGSTVSVNPRTDWLYISPGATIASLTIDLSTVYPGDGQRITILAEEEITSVTWTPVWDGPTSLKKGDSVELRYYPPSSAWFRASQKPPLGVPWTMVEKTAGQTITTSATLTDDNTLQFAMLANTTYEIRISLAFSFITGGYQYGIAGPSSPSAVRVGASNAYGLVGSGGTTGQQINLFPVKVENGANAGNFKVQFCQSSGAAGSITMEKGSYIEYRELA